MTTWKHRENDKNIMITFMKTMPEGKGKARSAIIWRENIPALTIFSK